MKNKNNNFGTKNNVVKKLNYIKNYFVEKNLIIK